MKLAFKWAAVGANWALVALPVEKGQEWLQCVMVWLAVMMSFMAIEDTVTAVVRRERR